MSYSVFGDIQSDFKNITFSSTFFITDTDVTQFIAEADALINSYVGQRWVTPITATGDALNLMKLYSRTLVADRVRGILATKQQTNTDANANVKDGSFSVRDVMKGLQAIASGDMQLSGATLLNANASFFSNNASSGVTPHFRRGVKQW